MEINHPKRNGRDCDIVNDTNIELKLKMFDQVFFGCMSSASASAVMKINTSIDLLSFQEYPGKNANSLHDWRFSKHNAMVDRKSFLRYFDSSNKTKSDETPPNRRDDSTDTKCWNQNKGRIYTHARHQI